VRPYSVSEMESSLAVSIYSGRNSLILTLYNLWTRGGKSRYTVVKQGR